MMKLHYADLAKRVYRLGIEILGPRSLAIPTDEDDTDWVDQHLIVVLDVDRRRHVGDPAQHHRRARARPAPMNREEDELMDLLPTSEQAEIVDSSAAFLADRISIARTRELFEAGDLPAIDDARVGGGGRPRLVRARPSRRPRRHRLRARRRGVAVP